MIIRLFNKNKLLKIIITYKNQKQLIVEFKT